MTEIPLPSQLPDVPGEVACDTETSGLFADDGARTSTVSVAWWAHTGCALATLGPGAYWGDVLDKGGSPEAAFCQSEACIASTAFPFDQGVEGKPEDNGQGSLFGQDVNLPEAEWRALLSWLLGRDGLVYHNAPFDLEKLRVGTRLWAGVELEHLTCWDTQSTCKELWPNSRTTSLKPTYERIWGGDSRKYETAIKDYLKRSHLPAGRYDLIPWDILGPYADMDARMTLRLRVRQAREIWEGGGNLAWCKREHALGQILYRMTRRGVPYDANASLQVAGTIQKQRSEIAARLPFVPTTPAAKKYYFGTGRTDKGMTCLGLPAYAVTEKNREPQLTAEILDRMVKDRVPHADTYSQYAQLETAESMWYRGYADAIGADGRLRTYFRQTKVVSGRYSAERINLMAMPHDYRLTAYTLLTGVPTPRQLIAARVADTMPGWGLWELDWAQAELRAAAKAAGCTRMIQMFRDGVDLHGYTATELLHVTPGSDAWPLMRQVGKRGNFTLCFGAGWPTFQKMVRKETGLLIPDEESERIVHDWNGLYPEYSRAIRRWSAIADQDKRVRLINGRIRWFSSDEFTHKAFNQYIQGSLAELGKDLMLFVEKLTNDLDIPQRGVQAGIGEAGMLLTIHDSVLLLLPDDDAQDIVSQICAWGSAYGSRMFDFPMLLEAKEW